MLLAVGITTKIDVEEIENSCSRRATDSEQTDSYIYEGLDIVCDAWTCELSAGAVAMKRLCTDGQGKLTCSSK